MEPQWLQWAKALQAIAQNGLAYSSDPFDIERFSEVRRIAAEMLAGPSGTTPERLVELFAGEVGYATPKVDVRGAVFRGDRLLLVKERSDQRWTLPGGWADVLQSPAECVVREVEEESGFRVRAAKLVAVLDRSKHPHQPLYAQHIYKLFFLCDLLDGTATTSIETEDVGFFAEDRLPELSIARVTPQQLALMFKHYRRPGLPTEFD